MQIIDAHHHLWNPQRGDYDWMPKDNPVLFRKYAPADLAPILERNGVGAAVMVQAAATTAETQYMLGLADATPYIAGVVGWVDFENRDDLETLSKFAEHEKFLGVRPMIQDIADPNWMLRSDIQWAFEAICKFDLTFDALGYPLHLQNFHTLLTRYPDMRVVIDHCMKPEIRNTSADHLKFWSDGMSLLAEDTSAHVKFSGLVTEDTPDWNVERLKPYADHIISAFGARRMMWGSDWPVCRLRCEYEEWLGAAQELTADLGAEDQAHIFAKTANSFYRLGL